MFNRPVEVVDGGDTDTDDTSRSADIDLSYQMRPDPNPIAEDKVPGEIYPETLTENNARHVLHMYLDALETDGW